MKTLAVVIGNDNYQGVAKLTNAVSDATSISQVFKRLGFEVILKINCSQDDIPIILEEFETKIKDYDASIFYFAGHGFEIDGENYLASIKCQIPTAGAAHANYYCFKLSDILKIHKHNTNKVNIVIIDACRHSIDRGINNSFAPVFAPQGTLIAYSTSPNEGAKDTGYKGHSIYTGTLLKYLDRESLSVEDLFKKVRKTVYALTQGTQTTWEHTSLINDYYFNTGKIVHSVTIPYDEKVVKDINYDDDSEFGSQIMKVKLQNWNVQNPAIGMLLNTDPKRLNKDQLFILGRNLLQASGGGAYAAINFMENIKQNIVRYTINGKNHLLNGILFEIYYDSHGEFRKEKTKKYYFEKIIALRKTNALKKSFEFICELLENTEYEFIYLPKTTDDYIDINITAVEIEEFNEKYEEIRSMTYQTKDIMTYINKYQASGLNENGIKNIIANVFSAPVELIKIYCNLDLKKIIIRETIDEDLDITSL